MKFDNEIIIRLKRRVQFILFEKPNNIKQSVFGVFFVIDLAFVLEERYELVGKETKLEYELHIHPIEKFLDLLENYWRGEKIFFENCEIYHISYHDLGWSSDERWKAKKWKRSYDALGGKPYWLFRDGIRRGYYLVD